MEPNGRCIGLIGGLGVGAAVHYYRELAKAHEAAHVTMRLLMAHADMHRIFRAIQADDAKGMAKYLADLIGGMQAGGAAFAVIPAVMPHYCIGELNEISAIPGVNLLDVIDAAVRARGLRRVALFGTKYTVESGLFGKLRDVEVVKPRAEEIEAIHNAYFQTASGNAGDAHSVLTGMAHRLCEREKLDAIVLAGTDLAVIFHEGNTDFPHVDCCKAHLDEIMRRALEV